MNDKKLLLSVDTDFFCRENPLWDFGHSEDTDLPIAALWQIRYMQYDLYDETDIKKYADCRPRDLFFILREKGLLFSEKTKVVAGWSHKFAYEVFLKKNYKILNIDAHHDCWEVKKELDCGNWGRRLIEKQHNEFIHIYPKWKPEAKSDDAYNNGITKVAYDNLIQAESEVDAIFIAQSPHWTPTHFDVEYINLVKWALAVCNKRRLDKDFGMLSRQTITKEEARELYQSNQKMMKKLYKKTESKK